MTDSPSNPRQDVDRLKGWKEIALVLHTSDRTVQRWEHSLHLPIHRVETPRGSIVYASRRELEAWLQSVEARTRVGEQLGTEPLAASAEPDGVLAAPISPGAARVSIVRRACWPALALAVLALFAGLAWRASSHGRGWATTEETGTPARGSDTEEAPAAPKRAALSATDVAIRLTFDDGARAGLAIPPGGVATCSVTGRANYALSAEVLEARARIHVSRIEATDPHGASRLNELAVLELRPGERVPVTQVPGLAAIEWIRPGPSGRSQPVTRPQTP